MTTVSFKRRMKRWRVRLKSTRHRRKDKEQWAGVEEKFDHQYSDNTNLWKFYYVTGNAMDSPDGRALEKAFLRGEEISGYSRSNGSPKNSRSTKTA